MAAQNCPSVAGASGRGNRGGLTFSGPLVRVGRSSVGENPPTKPTQNALAQNALAQNAPTQNAPTPEPILYSGEVPVPGPAGQPEAELGRKSSGFRKVEPLLGAKRMLGGD